jgi:anaerobic selenocysteine-containing dehydrogenase
MTAGSAKVLRNMCPMICHPTFCGMLVEVEGGKLKTVSGDKDNPDSQGFLCVRGRSTNEIFGNPRPSRSICSRPKLAQSGKSRHSKLRQSAEV